MPDSYSQYGEDLIVAAHFGAIQGFGNLGAGNLIDVGAYAPFDLSNSRLLIERGWDATLIELSPEPLKGLIREYAGSDRVRVVAAAVTACPQFVRKFRITDDAISCDTPEQEAKFKDLRPGYDGGFFGELWVPTLTVQQIVDQFYGDKPIHFANIDTEGTSVELAVEFMKLEHGWKPQCLCVEHDGRLQEIAEHGQTYGYRVEHVNGVNVILVRR